MVGHQRIEVAGKRFVLIEEAEYERLCARAGAEVKLDDSDLPPLPKPDKHGRYPAAEYARISLARDIIRDRRTAGLSQRELAELAGTRQETLSRIEGGKYAPSAKLVDKIDAALKKAIRDRQKRRERA